MTEPRRDCPYLGTRCDTGTQLSATEYSAHMENRHGAPRFATCRGCDRAFTKNGYGRQDATAPRLCLDCASREREGHPHSPSQDTCLAEYMRKEGAK